MPRARARASHARVCASPLPRACPSKLKVPPSSGGNWALKARASSRASRRTSISTCCKISCGSASFQFSMVSIACRMTSLPAGRSLKLSDPIDESSPPSTISEAIENFDGPRRATAMFGDSTSIRPASNLPVRSSCQISAATRPPAARANTPLVVFRAQLQAVEIQFRTIPTKCRRNPRKADVIAGLRKYPRFDLGLVLRRPIECQLQDEHCQQHQQQQPTDAQTQEFCRACG